MDSPKYIGMDVHKETISIPVLSSSGKREMDSVIETKAGTGAQFVQGQRGDLRVTLEEGTWAACLYDLLNRWMQYSSNLLIRLCPSKRIWEFAPV